MVLFLQDVRTATLSLLRKPAAPLLGALVLSLGIGANAAIFSLVDAVLFRALPVDRPDRIMRLLGASSPQGADAGRVSEPFFEDYRAASSSFSCLELWSDRLPVDVILQRGTPGRLTASSVSPGFFECLGVKPSAGTLLGTDDPDGETTVVLSDRLWHRRFARDPAAVGSVVHINRQPFVVVGVTPPGFEGIGLDAPPDLWLPRSQLSTAVPALKDQTQFRSSAFFHAAGRLAPGVDLRSVRMELHAIGARLGSGRAAREGHEKDDPEWREPWPWIEPAAALAGRSARTLARLLAGVAVLVLALAGADVAGLMLARAEGRRRELAVRVALGGSRWRVVRPLVLEALLISAAGALGGLLIAHAIVRLLATAPADVELPIAAASSVLAPRVLVASAAVAAAATLLAGAWPAFRASRVDPIGGLRNDLPVGAARLFSARGTLVSLQVCVATVLLIGVGALLRSLWAAAQIEPGVEPERVVLADLDLARGGYNKQRGAAFAAQLEEALTAAPGVPAAALSVGAPLEGGPTTTVAIDGVRARIDFVMVTPRYFETLGIQLTHGRSIERRDGPLATPVAVVNHAFARRFWPGAQPIGRYIAGFTPREAILEVVGVASDVRTHGLRKPAQPVMYVPMAQFYDAFPWQFGLTAMIRTLGPSPSGTNLIERTVHARDPMLPVLRPRSLAVTLGEPFGQQRLLASLLGACAALALLLAGTGLYGVISLTTAARTREFGVRIAVGALPRHMRRLVHGRSLALAGIGLLAGLAVALAGHRALQPFVFGISTTDPLGLAAAMILVLMVSIAAAEAPARRAMAVDIVQALRHE